MARTKLLDRLFKGASVKDALAQRHATRQEQYVALVRDHAESKAIDLEELAIVAASLGFNPDRIDEDGAAWRERSNVQRRIDEETLDLLAAGAKADVAEREIVALKQRIAELTPVCGQPAMIAHTLAALRARLLRIEEGSPRVFPQGEAIATPTPEPRRPFEAFFENDSDRDD